MIQNLKINETRLYLSSEKMFLLYYKHKDCDDINAVYGIQS